MRATIFVCTLFLVGIAAYCSGTCVIVPKCDSDLTANLVSGNVDTRSAAVEACLKEQVQPASQVYDKYSKKTDADKTWKDKKMFTYGAAAKFQSWGDRTNVYELQSGFQLGRETRHMYTAFDGAIKSRIVPGGTTRTDFLNAVKTLLTNHPDLLSLNTEDANKPPNYDALTTEQKVERSMKFEVAKAAVIYTHLIAMLESGDPNNMAKPNGVSDEFFNSFKAGVRFGENNGGLDSTGGLGVYFALNPVATAGGHGAQMVSCPVADNANVLNVDDKDPDAACIIKNLVKAKILLAPTTPTGQRGTGKNMLVHPPSFEPAAKRLKVLFTFKPSKLTVDDAPYVADKGAFDYTQCKFPGEGLTKLQKAGKLLGKLVPKRN